MAKAKAKANQSKMSKADLPEYILNPETGRYVLKTGRIGRSVIQANSMQVDNLVYPEELLARGMALKALKAESGKTKNRKTYTRIAKFLSDNGLDVAIARKDELSLEYMRNPGSFSKQAKTELKKLEKLLKTPVQFV